MHLELVELLRCPVPHTPSVLVAAADLISNRYMTEGLLGCPECRAEYPVRGGVTHFISAPPPFDAAIEISSSNSVDPMRLAAQLGLSAGRSVYALIGHDITTVVAMREIVAARMLLLNAPQLDATAFPTEQLQDAAVVAPIGVMMCGDVLPIVPGKFDGIAIQSANVDARLLEQSVLALRTGGRLVANVPTPLPAGVRELVRDEQVWVAERESVASAPIALIRR